MKRITKKVRDEAALICAIAASSGDGKYAMHSSTWHADPVVTTSGLSDAGELARRALCNVPAWFVGREAYAAAEALLRTGWLP